MSAYLCSLETFGTLAAVTSAASASPIRLYGDWTPAEIAARYGEHVAAGIEFEPETQWSPARVTIDGRYADGAALVARILLAENVVSLQAKYPTDPDMLSGAAEIDAALPDLAFQPVPSVVVLSLASGLRYQSCEAKDYQHSIAAALLEAIERVAIRKLPGFEAAPRDMTAADLQKRGLQPRVVYRGTAPRPRTVAR